MIKTSVIIWTVISTIICFGIPIGGFLLIQSRKQMVTRPFLAGALTFFLSQVVVRIPIFTLILPYMMWYNQLSLNPWLYGLFLGFTAGLFEEAARLFFLKVLCRKNRRYIDGIAFGLGHGGIEAILLVGINAITMLIYFFAINNGTFDSLTAGLDPSYASAIYQQYTGITALQAALMGVERIIAIIAHIGFSMIILTGIRKKRSFKYLVIAILGHTLLDAPIIILPQVFGVGEIGLEIYLALCAAVLMFYTIKVKEKYIDHDQGTIPADSIK
ncbi:MAG TPA: YhfC family intramembrane metalloprotease [Clostridiaceae bacterium]|nr:YhfC family intramembrane metalloprotease [Clostridiaceae bacterium]